MIIIHVNGEPTPFEESPTVLEVIRKFQIASPSIAVAVNAEIVSRSSFESVKLRDQDRVEIIRPVGGG